MATQAERTAQTTERLLDATIATLIERGYAGTSLPFVCRRAQMSRGAQQHHYPTKESLVAAAVQRLFEQRLSEFQGRLASTPSGVVDLSDAAEFMWRVYTGNTFYAWLELVVASRTDPTLREVIAPVDALLVMRAEKMCQRFLLPYVTDASEVKATTRLILSIFDGLAMHRILSQDDTGARRALRIATRQGLFTVKGRDA